MGLTIEEVLPTQFHYCDLILDLDEDKTFLINHVLGEIPNRSTLRRILFRNDYTMEIYAPVSGQLLSMVANKYVLALEDGSEIYRNIFCERSTKPFSSKLITRNKMSYAFYDLDDKITSMLLLSGDANYLIKSFK